MPALLKRPKGSPTAVKMWEGTISTLLTDAYSDGCAWALGNLAAGRRLRTALDILAKLKVDFRKAMIEAERPAKPRKES